MILLSGILLPWLASYQMVTMGSQEILYLCRTRYNRNLKSCLTVKQCSCQMDIAITNSGSGKANDIYVEIKFSEGLVPVEKKKVDSFPMPKNPMPDSIINKAQIEYDKDEERKRNPMKWAMNSGMPDYGLNNIFDRNNLLSRINHVPDFTVTLDNRVISIKLNSLLHTRERIFDEIMFLPLIAGTHDVNVSIICEEYDQSQNSIITINVL